MRLIDSTTAYRRFAHETRLALQKQQAEIEQATQLTRAVSCGLIPGLLQTSEYACGVLTRFGSLLSASPAGTGKAVAARIERQAVLEDPEKIFHYLVTESALRVRICPSQAMRVQLAHLVEALKRPNVILKIIPLDAEALIPPMHGFTLHDDRVVEIEMLTGALELTGPADLSLHQDAFNRFDAMALEGPKAVKLIEAAADTLP
ncbi:MAG TPA: DUF5753 domain-containing protein [Actinospica sp.]|nr:DUF5753 domain-containing protein [Actinospica sp.]